MKYSICGQWEFTEQWSEDFLNFRTSAQPVRLPHTCKELPLHHADSGSYQMVCGYRRTLSIPDGCGKRRGFKTVALLVAGTFVISELLCCLLGFAGNLVILCIPGAVVFACNGMLTVLPIALLVAAMLLFARKFKLSDARMAEIEEELHHAEATLDR